MARELAAVIGLKPNDSPPNEDELRELLPRLSGSGYPVHDEPDLSAMAQRRAEYVSCVHALAEHLGKPSAVLIRR